MEAFGQQLLAGVGTGSIYAIVALALAVIYQATHHVNFAQGEMAMFSTYLAWVLLQAGVPYWAAFFVTVAASFVMGAVLELAVIRPLRDAPDLSMVVVFIGLLVTFHGMAGWLFGYDSHDFPSPFANLPWGFPQLLSAHQAGSIALTFFLVALLFVFFYRTSLGLKMRAVAQNRVSSQLVGISVGKMLMLGWGLAGAIGAVSGLLVAPMVFLDPSMMMGAVLYAFAGALLGGIGNPAGAVVGGFLVGIAENLLGTYVVGTDLKLSIALLLIVVVLIFAPDGLFGRRVVTRV
ncbi:branched-chain amino acid ABC transporter permease [Paraburkholderia tuberum]|uniref:branched-chain amino acid ABC transporter permease n=1 Tax=Paraburkholderia TaxID=1822464 RepID=UPI0003650483|nr:branched-chain amino acid ABC transporter permease [Paraburkholderia tuberum]